MIRFTLRRLATGVVLMLAISFLTFVLISLPHPDIGRELLGPSAPQRLVDAKNRSLGLDRPLMTQYLDWLSAAVRGDLGRSWFTSEPVATAIRERLPVTSSLMLAVTAVTAVVSFGLGLWAGVRGGVVDRVIQVLGVVAYALPGFLVTLVLVLVFAVRLGWFPAVGYVPITTSFSAWLSSITLPVIALSVGSVAGVSQQVRGSVREVMAQDYVRTLRARGLPTRVVLFKHVLRNAAPPALTVLGLQFVGLIGGTVLVEQIFGLPGIGSMTVQYTVHGDVPIIMGLVMITVIGVVIVNLLVDLLIGWLAPRARLA